MSRSKKIRTKREKLYVLDNRIKDVCRTCGEVHSCLTTNCSPALFTSLSDVSSRWPTHPIRRATQEEVDSGIKVSPDQFKKVEPHLSQVILPPWSAP